MVLATISGPGNSSSGLGKNISGEEKGHFDRFPVIEQESFLGLDANCSSMSH